MTIGNRIRSIREQKQICQVDLAVRARLLRGYLSQVENGETVPDVGTLDRIASALEVPLHKLFYDGDEPPLLPNLPSRRTIDAMVEESAVRSEHGVSIGRVKFRFMYESVRGLIAVLMRKDGKRKPGK
jgi:transcriptional regulator with XRE-family HTH domain